MGNLTIDGFAFARRGGRLSVEIPVSECERVADQLIGDQGVRVEVLVCGVRDESGRHYLDLSVRAKLGLLCQRCLGEMVFPVDINRRLELVRAESDVPEDDLSDDGVDVIVAGRDMSVLELVEEEIILELPMVAMHENCSPPLQ